jgi:hypothetical protein
MVAERQRSEVTPLITGFGESYVPPPPYEGIKATESDSITEGAEVTETQKTMFFFGEVMIDSSFQRCMCKSVHMCLLYLFACKLVHIICDKCPTFDMRVLITLCWCQ